ncbi:MAG: hypothetical protein BEN19_04185 [Epulopiscium sp. Nuni2H_MBin003]|nr:MAG: hypothetical protein BEN19_04185 [Epulopiscium sp. Nuni2H_MBin003]
MQPVGFILFLIGLTLLLFGKRIVIGRINLEEQDKEEFTFLVGGAIIAVKLAGIIILILGFLFLLL